MSVVSVFPFARPDTPQNDKHAINAKFNVGFADVCGSVFYQASEPLESKMKTAGECRGLRCRRRGGEGNRYEVSLSPAD